MWGVVRRGRVEEASEPVGEAAIGQGTSGIVSNRTVKQGDRETEDGETVGIVGQGTVNQWDSEPEDSESVGIVSQGTVHEWGSEAGEREEGAEERGEREWRGRWGRRREEKRGGER